MVAAFRGGNYQNINMMKKKKYKTDFNDYKQFESVRNELKQRHQKIIEDDIVYNNEFADYLFNQFVIYERRDKQDISLNYLNALTLYAKWGLSGAEQTEQRRYAFKLEIIASEALVGWNTHLLILRGEEGKKEYEEHMRSYKYRLKRIGHDRASIKKMIAYKIKLNYGND